jgi:hypothetical protein
VPDESDTASTVALRISIPEESAMASLRVQPVPGWTVTTTTSDLQTPTVEGQVEPERPAPVLRLTAAADASHGAAGTATTTATDTAAAGTTGHADAGPGAPALFVALVALSTGLAGVVLGWRAGRRTVSP